jgi:hypothetical protein
LLSPDQIKKFNSENRPFIYLASRPGDRNPADARIRADHLKLTGLKLALSAARVRRASGTLRLGSGR